MAINPPNYHKQATPTLRGWVNPKTGELLTARKISQTEIDEYLGVEPPVTFNPQTAPIEEVREVLRSEIDVGFPTLSDNAHEENEDWHQGCESTDASNLENMSKTELEDLGRVYGIELDRRERKSTLIEKLSAVIG